MIRMPHPGVTHRLSIKEIFSESKYCMREIQKWEYPSRSNRFKRLLFGESGQSYYYTSIIYYLKSIRSGKKIDQSPYYVYSH